MTKQVKVFFVFLAAMAVVSVFSFLDIFGGVRSAKLFDDPKPLPLDITQDADQDGLSDTDESYWNTDFQNPDTDSDGFLDGEELASGNDPRESSNHPLGDSLEDTIYGVVEAVDTSDTDPNLSDLLGGRIAGAITAGDLTRSANEETKERSLGLLSLSAINDFAAIQNTLPTPHINIVASSLENQVQYISSLTQIIKENLLDFPSKLNTATSIEEQFPYFSVKSEQFRLALEKTSYLQVPENWVEIHKNIASILGRLYLNYKYVGGYAEDILKSYMALNELNSIDPEIKSILKSVQVKISEEKLTLDGSFYTILNLLYDN